MIRLALALFLAGDLLFLPLLAALRVSSVSMREGDTLFVTTQTRASMALECLAPNAQPYVPTPTSAP